MNRARAGWEATRRCFSVLAIIRFSLLTPSILLLSVAATDQMADTCGRWARTGGSAPAPCCW
jgi:hypothetical protein